MDFFQKPGKYQFKAIDLKSLRKTVYTTTQVGVTSKSEDRKRKALAPGKRISKNGKRYYETRKNRSDLPGKRI